jgi:hypothetical protein
VEPLRGLRSHRVPSFLVLEPYTVNLSPSGKGCAVFPSYIWNPAKGRHGLSKNYAGFYPLGNVVPPEN